MYYARYCHLHHWIAAIGDVVDNTMPIAASGGEAHHPGAGESTGEHFHFAVAVDGTVDDLSKRVKPEELVWA